MHTSASWPVHTWESVHVASSGQIKTPHVSAARVPTPHAAPPSHPHLIAQLYVLHIIIVLILILLISIGHLCADNNSSSSSVDGVVLQGRTLLKL